MLHDHGGLTGAVPRSARLMGAAAMSRVMLVCLAALAVNAVLIQTVVPEESSLKQLVRGSVLALVVFAMMLNNTRVALPIVLLVLSSAVLLLVARNTDQFSYVFVLCMVAALMAVPEQQVERAVLLGSLGSLALVLVFLVLGITHNEVLDHRNRATFGTNGAPFFYNLVYGACALLVLVATKRLRRGTAVLAWVAAAAAATYFFVRTDLRGGYVSFLAFLFLMLVTPRLGRSAMFRWIAGSLPVIFLALSFYIGSLKHSEAANVLLSYRPMLIGEFLEHVRPVDYLVGTSVKQFDEVVSSVTTVDNSYLHLLVGGGVLLCAAFVVLYWRAVGALLDGHQYADVAFLAATMLYFNTESILLRIENLFVVYTWYLVVRHGLVTRRRQEDVVGADRTASATRARTVAPRPTVA
ncbi:hypothetical protein GC089_14990 [Cellulomonas sp. JZ18]|uniref:hypothetical protein n=1 Tax=Cellulomonas sp. JZ18 TaxID=2654191 RepID=UPI0012D4473A|nr:hypothetical protein [Cellulomonas sp. JZ18]QGQ20264.1 hypothetical protein GC089_14990 [Cellulomonas sp. JZ18]